MYQFGLIGAAGFVAPRHIKAIKETGNILTAAYDLSDSVGVLDHFFPNAEFFPTFEAFDSFVNQSDNALSYMSICSPNYLHESHIRFALKNKMHAIVEKPLVIAPSELDQLKMVEQETGCRVFNILQLRLHSELQALKAMLQSQTDRCHDVDLHYVVTRGAWYHRSWKGDDEKSGGLLANIGVHFFDVLGWLFGTSCSHQLHVSTDTLVSGYSEYQNAKVRWFLSIDQQCLPASVALKGERLIA